MEPRIAVVTYGRCSAKLSVDIPRAFSRLTDYALHLFTCGLSCGEVLLFDPFFADIKG